MGLIPAIPVTVCVFFLLGTEQLTKKGLVWVKRVHVRDNTKRIAVSMWADLVHINEDLCIGNWIIISGLNTGPFNNEIVLGSTHPTSVEVHEYYVAGHGKCYSKCLETIFFL